ncbi:MAG: enoyl-CoA hydratase-related protein [Actinomycetota bacterium]|nr:enoyl-CoA hydratase-related protein [Actinomycetota bacterium]MDH5312427.1 enoyl-CoA hydratase-related protein [Actinomycetota bacterium]
MKRALEGPVATLTLDRPDHRNALDPNMLASLAAAIDEVSGNDAVRVVVITGAGSAFSAGADLEWMRASRGLTAEQNREDAIDMAAAFETVDRCPKAVIARVNGAAIGGGAGLVACTDVAIAVEGASFGFAEVRLGVLPAVVSPYVLRAIGPGRARELFTTGRTFEAADAATYGLVHRVVATQDLDTAIDEVAEAFLASGPEAVAANKRLVREATASLVLPDLAERIAEARTSAEGQEGVAAFLEKRTPTWLSSSDS